MLEITIPDTEVFNESDCTLDIIKGKTIQLEHSLLSVSMWESKWHIPFLEQNERTNEQLNDYLRCMTITKNVDPKLYECITREQMQEIQSYIEDPMTASTVKERDSASKKQVVTSELIYYWMIALEIPFECQKWHLNRLMMLIRICNIKNNPGKKMGKKELAKYNSQLNASRKAKLGTRG